MTEHAPQPERLTDEQLINLGIKYAELNNTVIPDSTARRIALAWHTGQTSPLYSLGSCGAIKTDELLPALMDCYQHIDPYSDTDEETQAHQLDHLAHYVRVKNDRGAVEGWHRTTADGLPAVVTVDLSSEPTGDHLGTYTSPREAAESLIATSGLYRALGHLAESYGETLARYVEIDVVGYARDLHQDILLMPNPDGTIDAYWR